MSEETKIDDGGPAFPRFVPEGHYNGSVHAEGMTLRDWFAGQALIGAYHAWMADCRNADSSAAGMATECYLIADAMLKARKQ